MSYKWCVVPLCENTTIKSPHLSFISVPTNPKKRKKWLELARRDPKSISSHTNVFMCEDHFDMANDTLNYMQYKMGFSHKILLADKAEPRKFHCQKDRKRRLFDAESCRAVVLKRQRTEVVTECLQTQSAPEQTETNKSLQSENNMTQEIIVPKESPKTQDKETITDHIISVEKSVQVTTKVNKHYRSKAVQTSCNETVNISTSPIKASTRSCYTSPFKIEPCKLQPYNTPNI